MGRHAQRLDGREQEPRCATRATLVRMRSISHRELRNQSGEVLRQVARGETYEVTNHGQVVARLSPPTTGTDLRCVRAAKGAVRWSRLPRATASEGSGDALTALRGQH